MDKITALVFLTVLFVHPAYAADQIQTWKSYIYEASEKFQIPQEWIISVIKVESHGNPEAMSSKGAMGLMQLMPETWERLSSELNLGSNPFDPRANILAGTAYLKAMHDRFGYPALFAAYNAGPERFEMYLEKRKALPKETQNYWEQIGQQIGFKTQSDTGKAVVSPLFFVLSTDGKNWFESRLFAHLSRIDVVGQER